MDYPITTFFSSLARRIGVLIGIWLVGFYTPQSRATTVMVTNPTDGALRSAIVICNQLGGGLIILSNLPGPIRLEAPLPSISGNLSIESQGSRSTLSGEGKFRVLSISAGAQVRLVGLDIRNGYTSESIGGGGMNNEGTLTLIDCEIANNTAVDTRTDNLTSGGGGIRSVGNLHLLSSRILSNSVTGKSLGSGFPSASGYGGGVFCGSSDLIASNTTFYANIAQGGVDGGGGGQGLTHGPGGAAGGGICVMEGQILLSGCSVVSNSAITPSYQLNANGASGGGVFAHRGSHIINSTLAGNVARGSVSPSGTGGNFSGGSRTNVFLCSTIVDGQAAIGAGIFGDAFNSLLQLRSSIVALNGDGTASQLSGRLQSLGNNLFEWQEPSGTTLDVMGHSPLLEPLEFVAGTGFVRKLRPRSPAIDAGNRCGLEFDQLRNPRTYDNTSVSDRLGSDSTDIGAVEMTNLKVSPIVTIPVTNFADSGPGTLRDAISRAYSAAFAVIQLPSQAGRVLLTADLPEILYGTRFIGDPSHKVTITASTPYLPQVKCSGASFSGLVFTNIALMVQGGCDFTDCDFNNAPIKTGPFGTNMLSKCGFTSTGWQAIVNKASLNLSDCDFHDLIYFIGSREPLLIPLGLPSPNSGLTTPKSGAAICSIGGTVSIARSNFRRTSSIYDTFPFTDRSIQALAGGAVLIVGGKLSLDECLFQQNSIGTLFRTESTAGGAVAVMAGQFSATNCLFTENQAVGGVSGHGYGAGGGGAGGAVAVSWTQAILSQCTFCSNTASTGPGGCRELPFACVPEANHPVAGSAVAFGGFSTGALVQCTIAYNKLIRAPAIASEQIPPGDIEGAVFVAGLSMLKSYGTIIAGNVPAESQMWVDPSYGKFVSLGYNLIGATNDVTPLLSSDLVEPDPRLLPLAVYGSGLPVLLPAPNSPVLDRSLNPGLSADARGHRRTLDDRRIPNVGPSDGTDAGAVERDLVLSYVGVAMLKSGMAVTFSTEPGNRYSLRYKDTLGNVPWSALPGSVTAAGQFLTIQDVSAGTNPSRFYQVLQE